MFWLAYLDDDKQKEYHFIGEFGKCRKPNGFGYPENNTVTYEFFGTKYTTESFKWIWNDGPGSPKKHRDLKLPNNEKLPSQGAIFYGEKGKLLLPHFMELPKLIVDGKYTIVSKPSRQEMLEVLDYVVELQKSNS